MKIFNVRTLRRKSLSLLLILMIASGVLVLFNSCSSKTKTSTEENTDCVELEYWNVFTGPDGDTMQKIVEDFNEEYEGRIKINTRVIASEDYYTTLLSAMISGIAPDVCVMHCSRLANFANRNLLYSLDDIVKKLGLDADDFVKVAWEAGEYSKVRYGIPLDIHPLGLYYNKTLLEEKGYSEPPKDLESFLEMAKACTYDNDRDGVTDVWGFAIDPNVMAEQLYWSVLYQFGGQAFNEEKTASAYNTKEGVNALQLLYDMIYKYHISQKGLLPDSAISMFEEGKLAFYSNGPWILSELSTVENLDFGTAAFPKLGKEEAVWADSHNIVTGFSLSLAIKQKKRVQEKTVAWKSKYECL